MINVAHEDPYRIEVSYASPVHEGTQFTVGPEGDSRVSGTTKATKAARDFRTDALGEIELRARAQIVTERISSLGTVAPWTCTRYVWFRFGSASSWPQRH